MSTNDPISKQRYRLLHSKIRDNLNISDFHNLAFVPLFGFSSLGFTLAKRVCDMYISRYATTLARMHGLSSTLGKMDNRYSRTSDHSRHHRMWIGRICSAGSPSSSAQPGLG